MENVRFPWCRSVRRFVWLCKYEWLLQVTLVVLDALVELRFRLKRSHPLLALPVEKVGSCLYQLMDACARYGEPKPSLTRLAQITTDEILDLHQMTNEELWAALRAAC